MVKGTQMTQEEKENKIYELNAQLENNKRLREDAQILLNNLNRSKKSLLLELEELRSK